MKRFQRRAHAVVWLLVAPTLAVVLWLGISNRPADPMNDALPPALSTEAP
ncbi:MAG: hypothetical protein AAFV47_14185 [Pseudomonadota bacterium]